MTVGQRVQVKRSECLRFLCFCQNEEFPEGLIGPSRFNFCYFENCPQLSRESFFNSQGIIPESSDLKTVKISSFCLFTDFWSKYPLFVVSSKFFLENWSVTPRKSFQKFKFKIKLPGNDLRKDDSAKDYSFRLN